jgi:tight adherence protein B
MALLIILVFTGAFAVVALLMIAGSTGASQQAKQVRATLESALIMGRIGSTNQILDIRKNELLSAIPWINRWLLKLELAPRLQKLLYQADLKWTAGKLLLLSLTCFLIPSYLIHLKTHAVILPLLIGVLLGGIPFAVVLQKRNQRFKKFEQGLPEAIDLMVSALRVGHSLNAAIGLVTRECPDPISSEFRICFDEQNYGLEVRAAMSNLVTRVPLQDLRMVVTAILIQKESGGNLAEVLDKTAHVIRERFRLKKQVQVHTAQGRLTGWILSFLPIALGIGLYFLNPDTMSLLWKREIGLKLLCGAGTMTIIGALIIRKIVRMEV